MPTIIFNIRVKRLSSHPRSGFPAQLTALLSSHLRDLSEKFARTHSTHHIWSFNAEYVDVLLPVHRSASGNPHSNVSANVRSPLECASPYQVEHTLSKERRPKLSHEMAAASAQSYTLAVFEARVATSCPAPVVSPLQNRTFYIIYW